MPIRVSKRTQLKFAEFATGYSSVNQIARAYEAEGFESDPDIPYAGGQRRTVCAGFHARIDPLSDGQQKRLVSVYLDAIHAWGSNPDGQLVTLARDVVRSLQRDGVPVDDHGQLVAPLGDDQGLELADFHLLRDPGVLDDYLDRMSRNIDVDTPAVIGAAKELVEAVCKLVLDDAQIPYPPAAGLPDLYRLVAQELQLSRESVPKNAKGSEAAQRVLQGLVTSIQNLAELRNAIGAGHGRSTRIPALERHARLAMNASRTVTEFLLSTWHARSADRETP